GFPRGCTGRRKLEKIFERAQYPVVIDGFFVDARLHHWTEEERRDVVAGIEAFGPGEDEKRVVRCAPRQQWRDVFGEPCVAHCDCPVVHVVVDVGDDYRWGRERIGWMETRER